MEGFQLPWVDGVFSDFFKLLRTLHIETGSKVKSVVINF